jgi:uncharacterized Tic20 family protein
MEDNHSIQSPDPAGGGSRDFRLWTTLLHLSVLSGFVLPLIGSVLVPIVIYILKKDEHPGLTPHFNTVMNWIISVVIYAVAAVILAIVTLGLALPLMFLVFGAIALLSLVFAIVGAIKANDGELWVYPLSIPIMGRV